MRIESRLDTIEQRAAAPDLSEELIKSNYSCGNVAELTQQYGTRKVKTATVRLACSDGRIPDVYKANDGSWRIPKETVLLVLSEASHRGNISCRM